MAIKKYKPTTPGRRGMTGLTFEEITKKSPEKSLCESFNKSGGRNNTGLLQDIMAAVISSYTVLLTSRETRMIFLQLLRLLNTTLTEMPISH